METIVIAGVIVAGTYLLARKSSVGRRLFDNHNRSSRPKLKKKLPLGMSDKDYIKKVMAENNQKFQHEAKIAEERARSDRHSL